MNRNEERGYLESFKADPYEMFEQVARPLSGCRFTCRGGKGGIEMVTTRGTYCPFSFGESRIYNFRHEDPVFFLIFLRFLLVGSQVNSINRSNCVKR